MKKIYHFLPVIKTKYYIYTYWEIDPKSPTRDKDHPECIINLKSKRVTKDYFKNTKGVQRDAKSI